MSLNHTESLNKTWNQPGERVSENMNTILTSITQPTTWYDVLIAVSAATILMIIFVSMLNALKRTYDINISFTITKRVDHANKNQSITNPLDDQIKTGN